MLAKGQLSQHFVPGTHASTFGGNPLATCAGLATIKELLSQGFFDAVNERSQKLIEHMDAMVQRHDHIISRKGEGMLLGLEFSKPVGPLVKSCLEAGLLVGSAGANVLRLAPALNLTLEHLKEGIDLLNTCLENTSL
jgi:acetylornithine/succinyldiaminopimelate/putrescine aminotransferase